MTAGELRGFVVSQAQFCSDASQTKAVTGFLAVNEPSGEQRARISRRAAVGVSSLSTVNQVPN